MQSYIVKLKNRKEIAEGTMSFYFEKPEGFEFQAGQHAVFTLINPPETDGEGNRRVFCFASAPCEEDVMIAMRMRDTAFKRVLRNTPIGSKIKMDGPYGSFVLHEDSSRQAVLLAGGIGITPFRSMIVQSAKENLPYRLFLFYSNRRPQDSALLDELQCLPTLTIVGAKEQKYKCIATMTEMERSTLPWDGERGYITKEMLERHIENLEGPIYYIAGPPAFVFAIRGILKGEGVGASDVRFDQFAGY